MTSKKYMHFVAHDIHFRGWICQRVATFKVVGSCRTRGFLGIAQQIGLPNGNIMGALSPNLTKKMDTVIIHKLTLGRYTQLVTSNHKRLTGASQVGKLASVQNINPEQLVPEHDVPFC